MNSRRFVAIGRWAASFAALACIVATYRFYVHVNPTTVALTLVLFVLVLAARWEMRYAVVASFAACAAYNFFFLPPVGTFTIADPQNWLALFSFLGTSIIGSRLSQRARDESATVKRKQHELEVLYQLSRELLQTETVADALEALPALINSSALADSVVLYLLDGDRLYLAGLQQRALVDTSHLRSMALSLPAVTAGPGNEVLIPLKVGLRPRGLLSVRGASLTPNSLEAVGGLVSIILDHAQAIEEAARSEANKKSERLRTLILDSITHELRTPLTSIKGAAGTLLSNLDVDRESRRELISIVDEEADRLNRLVGQAVEMAKIEAREVQMHLEPLSIEQVAGQAMEACSNAMDSHEVEMSLSGFPPVLGDSELLNKVLCNLLDNAAKYSPAGSPIFIAGEAKGSVLAVSVADRGVGIDPSEQSLIFERLYRSRAQSEKTPGTGMGLAICRAIVEAHHGELNVTSQPGKGSVFTFTVPWHPHLSE